MSWVKGWVKLLKLVKNSLKIQRVGYLLLHYYNSKVYPKYERSIFAFEKFPTKFFTDDMETDFCM